MEKCNDVTVDDIIADVLSSLPNPEKNAEIPLDVTVDDIMLDVDDETACSIDMINFSLNKRVQLREMSTADPTLCALQRVVYSGWPDTIKDLPKDLRPYWSYRDEIGISDGVIFKGKQVIIPDALKLTSELRKPDYSCASLCTGQTSIRT